MLSALGQAAPEMPSHVVDVIMDCLQERDQEVRQLWRATGGKVQQLENELHTTRQEKAAMEARCKALQHHFQATSGHIADVVKRAGGAAESTEALEAEVAALRQRLQTAEAAREESEALAAQEQESARQLVEAMDQGLQRQREQYLRLESDMASQDDEAAELRYRNALLGDHVNHLHHALGALHQRRRRHALLSSVLTEWCGLAAERCALHHLQEATRRRLALSWRRRLFAAWRAEARLAADRASTITSALTLAACEAFRTQAQLPAAASLCRTQCWPIRPGSASSLVRVARVAAAFLRWHRFLELRRHKRWACRVVQSRADARQREAAAAAFLAWRGWGAACRENARAMRLMQRMRARHVLLGAFRHWKSLALVEQTSAASRERGCLAASLSARASLRLAYSAWAAWSSQVARGRLLDQFTRRHCLRSLALVWRAWKDAVHATLSKEFDSISIYIYRLLSSCLHAWRHISVGARRLKHIERVVLGRDMGKVLATCLYGWADVAARWRLGRARLIKLADRLCADKARDALTAWAHWRIRRRAQAALLLQVAVRRERQALARALRGWAHWLAVRRIQAGMFGRMAERCELSTVLGALRAWQGYARMRATQAAVMRQMIAGQAVRLLEAAFRGWAAATARGHAEAAHLAAAALREAFRGWAELADSARRGRAGMLASCLAGWRQAASSAVIAKLQGYNHRLRCFEAALRQMSSKGETSALRGALLGWRGLVARAGETRRRLAAFCWRGALRRLRRLFGAWRELRQEAAIARLLATQNDANLQLRVLQGAFSTWRGAAARCRQSVAAAAAVHGGCEGLLSRVTARRLRGAWQSWRMAIAERLANELMMELADRLRRRFEVVHLHALLHAWLDHADYRRALEGLKEAAEQQHRRRRLSASWRAWRTHTVTLLAVRSSIAVAHTAWAFDRWRANASDSRRDRLLNQCSGALADHRRDRLLSSAFVAWVEQWRISRIFRLQEGRRARAAEAALSGLLMPSSAGVRYGWVHSSSALSSTPSGAENCVKIPTLASEATPPRQCWDRSGLGGLHELVAALERRHRAGGAGAAAPTTRSIRRCAWWKPSSRRRRGFDRRGRSSACEGNL
eukprot:jgi/Tetstr1/460213/TSEL_005528.t1